MNIVRLFLATALLAACGVSESLLAVTLPAPVQEKLDALQKAIQAANADAGPGRPGMGTIGMPFFGPGNEENAYQQLESMAQSVVVNSSSDAVKKAARELIAAVDEQIDRNRTETLAKIEALLQPLPATLRQAKKPADLDPTLAALQTLQSSNRYASSPEVQAGYQKISGAVQYVMSWQDYLAASQGGRLEEARMSLRNLSQNNFGASLMPRSEVLALLDTLGQGAPGTGGSPAIARQDPMPQALQIVQATGSLEGMDGALPKLDELRQAHMDNSSVMQLRDGMASLDRTYHDIKAGFPTNYSPSQAYSGGDEEVRMALSDLRAKLLAFVVIHYVQAPADLAPQSDEPPQAYVGRVLTEATKRGDWELLRRAVEVQSTLLRSPNAPRNLSAGNGFDSLLAAMNQEKAQQYQLAVMSYQAALKSSESDIPAKMIGDRLAAIQKDHPQEYDAAMERVLAPSSRYPSSGLPPELRSERANRQTPRSLTLPGTNAPPAVPEGTPAAATPPPSPAAGGE